MSIAENRRRLETDLTGSWRRAYLSPAMLSLHRALVPRLERYARGSLLDVGCGTMPYRRYLPESVKEYHSLDVEARAPGVDFIADVGDMTGVKSARYDTVLCTEVMEHLPRPERLLREVDRVLKPGGHLILTVPYLCRLHEEPFDFYRYTRYGLQHLLEGEGLRVLEITPTGSVLSFLGHQFSTIVVGGAWHVPIVRHALFYLNAAVSTVPCYWLDQRLGSRDKFPLGYVAMAVKENSRE